MTDSHLPRADGPADDAARCFAYLEGELTAAETAAFEAQLADEPGLAETLERTRAVLEALASVGTADPAPGYGDRLRAALAEARDERPGAAGDERTVAASASGRVVPLSSLPRHRVRKERPWMGIAATLVLFAVLGGGVVSLLFGTTSGEQTASSDSGGEDLAEADAEPEIAEAAEGGTEAGGADARSFMAEPGTEEAGEDDAAGAGPADEDAGQGSAATDDSALPEDAGGAHSPSAAPSVVDEGVVLADSQALGDHLGGRREAAAVLGVPLAEVPGLADEAVRALESAPPFRDGTRPEDCLDAATGEVDDPALPVRVEALTYAGESAVAYLLATPGDASDVLDRVQAVLIAPEGCDVRLVQDVTGAAE
jgi:hypothetical protein